MTNPMEEMDMPCPEDICDGTGVLEDGSDCLCKTDVEYDEIY